MMGYEDRAASIRTAQKFAESKGFSVAGWHQYAITQSDSDLLAYYGDGTDPKLAEASSVAPAREVQVLFRSPDQTHEFRVYLSLSGQVTGYDYGKSTGKSGTFNIGAVDVVSNTTHHSDDDEGSMKDAITVSDREAESIARKALAENTALSDLVHLGKADISAAGDDSAKRRWFGKKAPLAVLN